MLIQQQPNSVPTWLAILHLLRWDKPAGRLILMVPALWAVFLAARGTPPIPLIGAIVLGTLATSAAGCAINDLWDRDIDPQVERTRTRPLASRALSIRVGIVVAAIAMGCAGILALYLNAFTFWLCVAAVPVIILYPSAKRVFPIPQLVLAIAWGFAVLISWSAVTANLEPATWLLWGATVLWTLGFDTVYAMSDREDDIKIGVRSSALFFGDRAPEAVGIFFAATAGLLVRLGLVMELHFSFWITLSIATLGWIWHYTRLRQPDIPKPVYGEVFRQNVWIGFVLLFGMIAGSIF
ncbi:MULTISPECIES: 4-hydroxybenzoate solanesyltransferase [unclassified Coleofasciculus]|uniref:4-hydroxybenzoate solanesyltransferase n=1 Tax=unclassified Coleofasciculus TaxID=2692782 RepID=UPI001880EE37|nr:MULTISPECIES: 4-hydroxybenzoate solanesyltransferase [unclassified Coleofasciculus]MBE9126357.1 4-hydroxybenzoate solanesyltransferase [Coleofasciculus sp. LEGE 07081]MBE9150010.1 4-hydroxybenzoate solanesyltransferase [Coleofasciculus sp. LEGE 07092]